MNEIVKKRNCKFFNERVKTTAKNYKMLHEALDVHVHRCRLMKYNIALQSLMETHLPHHHA